jgi:hypothetical protein
MSQIAVLFAATALAVGLNVTVSAESGTAACRPKPAADFGAPRELVDCHHRMPPGRIR